MPLQRCWPPPTRGPGGQCAVQLVLKTTAPGRGRAAGAGTLRAAAGPPPPALMCVRAPAWRVPHPLIGDHEAAPLKLHLRTSPALGRATAPHQHKCVLVGSRIGSLLPTPKSNLASRGASYRKT